MRSQLKGFTSSPTFPGCVSWQRCCSYQSTWCAADGIPCCLRLGKLLQTDPTAEHRKPCSLAQPSVSWQKGSWCPLGKSMTCGAGVENSSKANSKLQLGWTSPQTLQSVCHLELVEPGRCPVVMIKPTWKKQKLKLKLWFSQGTTEKPKNSLRSWSKIQSAYLFSFPLLSKHQTIPFGRQKFCRRRTTLTAFGPGDFLLKAILFMAFSSRDWPKFACD